MVCAACLRAQFAAGARPPGTGGAGARRALQAAGRVAGRAAQVGGGVLLAWFFFHLAAQKLASLPERFHEGTFWKATLLGQTDDE